MKPVTKLVFAILPVLLIIGCGTKGEGEDETTGESVTVSGPSTTEPASGVKLDGGDTAGAEATDTGAGQDVATTTSETALTDDSDQDLLSERKVYFDYDRSEIKPEFREILSAHANYLASNPSVSVSIEGHCDERGTREYNIALGERRAHSVLQFLTLQGVSKSQINTVSYGEERPDVEGHDESAWKWNRRAVFVYAE